MNGKVVATLGKFEVHKALGREWLYCDGVEVAQCISGDHVKQHGGLAEWVEHVNKRSKKRMAKIISQIDDLTREHTKLVMLTSNCVDARLEHRRKQNDTA